jgi:uncharacterized membrane protein
VPPRPRLATRIPIFARSGATKTTKKKKKNLIFFFFFFSSVEFFDAAIGELLQIILQQGVLNDCSELCGYLPTALEAQGELSEKNFKI